MPLDLVTFVLQNLVAEPDRLEVNATSDGRNVHIDVSCAPDDVGRIIGRGGASSTRSGPWRVPPRTAASGSKCSSWSDASGAAPMSIDPTAKGPPNGYAYCGQLGRTFQLDGALRWHVAAALAEAAGAPAGDQAPAARAQGGRRGRRRVRHGPRRGAGARGAAREPRRSSPAHARRRARPHRCPTARERRGLARSGAAVGRPGGRAGARPRHARRGGCPRRPPRPA